jgi:hypothetical protein
LTDPPRSDQLPVELNTHVPHPARVYDYWLGGKERLSRGMPAAVTLRSRSEIARFFDGLELVEPGMVQVHRWRPDPGEADPERKVSVVGGVARKP